MTTETVQEHVARPPQTYLSVLKLKVPNNTQWDASRAEQLMIGLFSIGQPVKLEIGATAGRLEWAVVVPYDYQESTLNYIYSQYPNATITPEPKQETAIGYRLYTLHATAPFVAPLLHGSDFNGVDPLSAVLKAMSQVQEGEQIIYELMLIPPRFDHYKLGEKLLTKSQIKWWHFTSLDGLAAVAASKSLGIDKVNRYAPDIQRMAQAKLNATLKDVLFSLKVKAATPERADDLVALLEPGLASFERPGFNFLVPPQAQSFSLVLSAKEVAAFWHLPNEQCHTPGIAWSASVQAPYLATTPPGETDIEIGRNVYQGDERTVTLAYGDREAHVNMFGRPGVGKTNLMHHLIHQDIAAGHGVAVIDPHGDLIDDILARSIPPEREQDVVLFDVKDKEHVIGLNLLAAAAGVDSERLASEALGVVRKLFADSWSASRMEDTFYASFNTLIAAGEYTLMDVTRFLMNSDFRHSVLSKLTDPMALEYWEYEFEPLTIGMKMEITRPISTRLRKFYRDQTMRRIMGQTDCLDFRAIMDGRKIFLAKISGLGQIETETLGALLMSRFQLAALSRGDLPKDERRPFYLHIDEVQSFITTSLPVVFSEARKFGLSLTVANQFTRQLSGETLEAVLGTSGATVIFGIGPNDAQVLAPYVRPQFAGDDLIALDKFHAAVRMRSGGQNLPAFSIKTPVPIARPADADEREARIRQQSRQRYGRHSAEIDGEIRDRFNSAQETAAKDDGEQDGEENPFLG